MGIKAPWFLLAPFALGGGLLLASAYAPIGWWPAAFVAVAVLGWTIAHARGLSSAVGLGLVFGVGFLATSLAWQTMIAALSYTALVGFLVALQGVLAAGLYTVRDWRLAPLLSAGLWTLSEYVLARWPFDGFAWLRLGYSQVDSPLAGFYPFTGAASVTFLVALVGHLLAAVALRPRTGTIAVAGVVTAALLAAGALGVRWDPAPVDRGRVDVGWVQGGAPGGGVYGLGEPRTIVRNHARETEALVGRIAAGDWPQPDFLVWPENSTDLDPFLDATTNAAVTGSVRRAGVPILVGAVTQGPGPGERQTTALWWTADGVTARYDKRNLVPFGEWIPFRDVLLPLVPLLAYVGDQSVPGTTPGALPVVLPDGREAVVGVAICYEVIYPRTLYEAADAGAQVMFVQSSNAMYQGSNQIEQQFAITRVRAAEMRREILVVTTSGVSGRIDAHGGVAFKAPQPGAASGVETMTLSEQRTPVMAGGWLAEDLLAIGALLWLALGLAAHATGRMGENGSRTALPRAVVLKEN